VNRDPARNAALSDDSLDLAELEARAESLEEDASEEGIRADAALAKRCIAGEVAAWEEYYAQCHDALLSSIKIMLGTQQADPNLVDEIAARVWYALVADDGALLVKYSPKRGARLITFMRLLAKDEIIRHVRAERRRRKRELTASRRNREVQHGQVAEVGASFSEFLGTLSPKERVYANDYLLAEAAEGPGPLPAEPVGRSVSTVWRFTGRIKQKLLNFLGL